MSRHEDLLDPERTALIVVDVQERFRDVIHAFDAMLANCVRLVRTFRALELPILVTEQYPKGLGHTVAEIAEHLGAKPLPEKTAFSSMGCDGVPERLADLDPATVVVCGLETHVCVSQTVHDLLHEGYRVHLCADAVSSRRTVDRDVALLRLAGIGAVRTTAEAVAFELLRDARHPRFREIQAFYK
jgi:nicotinamidase-related amidase